MLFMLNAYYFNASESHVINTLQTLTSWCERGDEVHVVLYTTSHELAPYVLDSKQRFFCQRLSAPLPVAVLEYDKNVTLNIAGMHRYLVAEKIDEYDWFLYTEDDLALTHSHVRYLQKWTRLLAPKGTLPHLMRYEVASVRPLGLRRDALLLDEYPLPLSLYRMEVASATAKVATRSGCHLDSEEVELDELSDDDDEVETLEDEHRDREQSSIFRYRSRGDVASLLSRRRRQRRRKDVGGRHPRERLTSPLSFMKTSRVRSALPASHTTTKKGTEFIRLPNPYMAMWLLPRDMLLSHVRESRWLDEVNDCPNNVRVHFATFWLRPHFSFAVPLSSFRRALIHHVSTKYAGHGLMQVDTDRRHASHPFFLHRFFNVDAWDLERTLSECMIDDGRNDDTGGTGNDAASNERTDETLFEYAAMDLRFIRKHPSSIALQSPRILGTSACSSCFNAGGNISISVGKREMGEPLEYKIDCLRSERKQ